MRWLRKEKWLGSWGPKRHKLDRQVVLIAGAKAPRDLGFRFGERGGW